MQPCTRIFGTTEGSAIHAMIGRAAGGVEICRPGEMCPLLDKMGHSPLLPDEADDAHPFGNEPTTNTWWDWVYQSMTYDQPDEATATA